MKFGRQLESESVPAWSIQNLDYNTLKQFIKVNTTRDQASAITIPGQKDTALQRFENEFYEELCRQHSRINLFVTTKSDEFSRRLQELSDNIHRLLLRGTSSARTTVLKRQRRFAKLERVALEIQGEINDLTRFVNAQVVGFRKILKKYRKWTGSSTLTARFRDNVLDDPKSFTRHEFDYLETHCEELIATLHATTPISSLPQTPRGDAPVPEFSEIQPARRSSNANGSSTSSATLHGLSSSAETSQPSSRPAPQRTSRSPAPPPPQTHYWNEYDDGSEAGEEGYAIYIHPDDEDDFMGMATIVSFFTVPYEKAKKWVADHRRSGRGPALLSGTGGMIGYGTTGATDASSLFDTLARSARIRGFTNDDVDRESTEGDEDASASDSDFPQGYEAHYAALPSINEQRLARYRDMMLFRGTIGCFAAALVLLGVAAILISTGKHKLRVEVDAGVIVGVMASLGFACAALGMSMSRHDNVRMSTQIAVWAAFAIVCALNGATLVLVMGNTVIATGPQ